MDDKGITREEIKRQLKEVWDGLRRDEAAQSVERYEGYKQGKDFEKAEAEPLDGPVPPRGAEPLGTTAQPGTSERTFGWGMLGLTFFTLLVGAYPLRVSYGTRAMFLLFAVVELFVAAYFLDRSRKREKSNRESPSNSEPPPHTATRKSSLRRLK